MIMTIEKALASINGQGTKPLLVNVNNSSDYCLLCKGLFLIEKSFLSSYFIQGQPLPDTDKLIRDVSASTRPIAVLGLTQYLAFKDEQELIQALNKLAWTNRRVIVVCYQLESLLASKICSDIRLKDRVLLINGTEDEKPTLTLSSFSVDNRKLSSSLQEYFKMIEDLGGGSGSVVTKIKSLVFENGLWRVSQIASPYEALCLSDTEFQNKLPRELGTDVDWAFLHEKLSSGRTFDDICIELFGTLDLVVIVRQYKTLDARKKWLLFLALIQRAENNYITFAAKQAKTASELMNAIYNAIMDIKPTDRNFAAFYNERKLAVKDNSDLSMVAEYCNLVDARGRNKIYYLTDLTEKERKEIIKCICEYQYTTLELSRLLPTVYPLLSDYIAIYYFGKELELLTSYFEKYKEQKLRNQIEDGFVERVNEIAKVRPYNELLAPRTRVFARTDDTILIWVDALGVEFMSFISRRSEVYGMKAQFEYARAKLPTLTGLNKEFFDETCGDIKVEDLDQLKHNGEGDYDYSKTQLPLYIMRELEIIDSVLETAKSKLSATNRVVIISDHGASRLARIKGNHDEVITVDAEVDGKHGGRCCKWIKELSDKDKYPYLTDDENGYCAVANYDKFNGGKFTGVEMHGGATLEEVVVPVITLTLKTVQITARLKHSTLTYARKKLEPLVVTLSNPISKPRLRIGGKFYDAVSTEKNTTYIFELDLRNPSKYEAVVLDNNQEVAMIFFEIKSATGRINDIL
jgi:hypothetical protein